MSRGRFVVVAYDEDGTIHVIGTFANVGAAESWALLSDHVDGAWHVQPLEVAQ